MSIIRWTAAVFFAGAFALLAGTLGPLVAAYVSAFVGLGLVVGMLAYSAFVALRNWRLDKLLHRHSASPQAVEPREETRRAA